MSESKADVEVKPDDNARNPESGDFVAEPSISTLRLWFLASALVSIWFIGVSMIILRASWTS